MQPISTSNLNELRKQIQLAKKNKQEVVVQAQLPEFNRKIFENSDVDVVIGLELHSRKDRLKQRDSGLNEVLCKLASKNNIKIGVELDKIKNLAPKEKAVVFSRVIQNIKLCRRANARIILLPKQNKQEAVSFMLSLGASTQQAKQATE